MGAQKDMGLHPYACAFVEGGLAVLVFDYRTFGGSGGQPRQWVSPARHCQDWQSAVDYVKQQLAGKVDTSRMCLWGSSFAGGHVLVTAANNPDNVVAVVSQVGPAQRCCCRVAPVHCVWMVTAAVGAHSRGHYGSHSALTLTGVPATHSCSICAAACPKRDRTHTQPQPAATVPACTAACHTHTNLHHVLSQVPHLDARAATRLSIKKRGIPKSLACLCLGLLDRLSTAVGLQPVYLPLVGPVGSLAFMQLNEFETKEYFSKHPAVYQGGWTNKVRERLGRMWGCNSNARVTG